MNKKLLKNTQLKAVLFSIFFFVSLSLSAARVDTLLIRSGSMQKNIKCVIITPDGYENGGKQFPVVYLLHGYSGNYGSWVIEVPFVKKYADEFQMIIVCPDGNFQSWYVNSPVDTQSKYETFISKEVPEFIDSNFKTKKDRKFRAVSGLSMGGHGALLMAAKHPDVFGAAGSMSGALDLNSFKGLYGLPEIFGDSSKGFAAQNSVINNLGLFKNASVALIIDCGVSDVPFISDARNVHEKLLQLNIPHDYIEREGKHEWEYWRRAIGFQLLFFRNQFESAMN